MFVRSFGSAVIGIDAITIGVEVDITSGIGMCMVGLPDNAVRESQERIRSAFGNSGYKMSGKKIVVNLSPADIRKEGSAYDLPIAVSILAASGQLDSAPLDRYIVMGELSLDGTLLPVKGALPIAVSAYGSGFEGIILPVQNAAEAAVVEGLKVYGFTHLREVVDFMRGRAAPEPVRLNVEELFRRDSERYDLDFSDVRGQLQVKRALEIAAAGGHNVLMIGPPGSGKTMLARRMPSIMPPMQLEEALETTKIHSVAGKLGTGTGLLVTRPFRAPHHQISPVALIGGGSTPQPGEISLAHNGILFADELPEFRRDLLESMRQPMEDKQVVVSRVRYTIQYPANFMLIASMNPCPCGYYNHPTKECVCAPGAVSKYLHRISGPLLDRIDMHVEVIPVDFGELSGSHQQESSASVRRRVVAARAVQTERFKGTSVYTNAMMNTRQVREFCQLAPSSGDLLRQAMERFNLSARAYERIVKLARTIADLAGSATIETIHIAEAIRYRSLDRDTWGR